MISIGRMSRIEGFCGEIDPGVGRWLWRGAFCKSVGAGNGTERSLVGSALPLNLFLSDRRAFIAWTWICSDVNRLSEG